MHSFRIALLTLLSLFCLGGLAAGAQTGITTDSLQVTWKNLTEEQKAQVAKIVAEKATENRTAFNGSVVPKDVTAQEVEPWLVLIDKVGQGLVRLAQDLGVTANELLATPVGIATIGLVAYHVMGNEIMGILTGLLFFSLAFPVWLLCFYKMVVPVVKHETVMRNRLGRDPVAVQVPVRRRCTFEDDSGPEWVSTISLVLIFLITVLFLA
jgi:hypothetical protein